ncbi:hypothetical protein [Bacillus pseudomycoides]|uniref:hypothetical protein n=1 Tax=Bacillus pseudomycoides TaxID=64104 RepID=UPI000BFA0DF4|nr:hypothetical protein [Bacillus pseudomycoides]PGF06095.1 hypothetical protein COM59_26315 [Bacillus pseudomycoides]
MSAIVIPEQDPREIIEKYFPRNIRTRIPEVINNAYGWCYIHAENTPLLNWTRGKSILPNIKNIAVEFFVREEIKKGNLPFQWRVNYNRNRSASLIEIYNDEMVLHINQVAKKSSIARPAYCRDQYIKSLQCYWDFGNELNSEEPRMIEKDKLYFQLNHGYQSESPLFVSLGIPGKDKQWVEAIQLLDEFVTIQGVHPKSKVEEIPGFSLEDLQQFTNEVERDERNNSGT